MALTLIGLFLNFIGTFSIIIETISGEHIRPNIYHSVLKGRYEYDIDNNPVKKKLESKEIRVLVWLILICLGFFLQIVDFII